MESEMKKKSLYLLNDIINLANETRIKTSHHGEISLPLAFELYFRMKEEKEHASFASWFETCLEGKEPWQRGMLLMFMLQGYSYRKELGEKRFSKYPEKKNILVVLHKFVHLFDRENGIDRERTLEIKGPIDEMFPIQGKEMVETLVYFTKPAVAVSFQPDELKEEDKSPMKKKEVLDELKQLKTRFTKITKAFEDFNGRCVEIFEEK